MSEEERDYEAEARESGWKPAEEWEGDPPRNGFKSAEQFVLDGERSAGIQKSRADELANELKELKGEVKTLLKSNEKLHEWSEKQRKQAEQEKQQLIQQLEEQQVKAVSEGDGEAFRDAQRQLKDLEGAYGENQPQTSEQASQWLEANPWYSTDDQLGGYADRISDRVVADGYTPDTRAYYDEITKRVKENFPEKFENPSRKKPATVEDGTSEQKSDGRTWDDLPSDAKKAYADFRKSIPGFTKEAYLANYEWE